jgi:hypothetical protein
MTCDGGQFAPAGGVGLRFGIQDVKDSFTRSATRLQNLIELVQAFDGIVEKLEQQQEGGEIAGLNLASHELACANPEHDDHAGAGEEVHARTVDGPDAHDVECGRA